MSFDSHVQQGRTAAVAAVVEVVSVVVVELSLGFSVELLCPLIHVSWSDEMGVSAPRLPRLSNGNRVWKAASEAKKG
jgi:hypothetical protein